MGFSVAVDYSPVGVSIKPDNGLAVKRTAWASMRMVCAVMFSLWVASPVARAYEGQLSVDARVAWASLVANDRPPSCCGPLLELGVSVGLSDVWTLRGSVGAARHIGTDAATVGFGLGELLYVVDIVEWVPYFGGGSSLWYTRLDNDVSAFGRGQDRSTWDLAIHGVAGIDYLLTRHWSLGADGRVHYALLTGDSGGISPLYFTIGLRAAYRFEL